MRLSVNELNQVRDALDDVKTSYKSVDTLYTVLKVCTEAEPLGTDWMSFDVELHLFSSFCPRRN